MGVVSIVTLFITIFSSSLLKTKTTYQSKAASATQLQQMVGGTEVTDPAKWPFMVRLFVRRNPIDGGFCDGTLISDQWVLTAAHCIEPFKNKLSEIKINIGSTSLLGGMWDPVDTNFVVEHPKYDSVKKINDLALVKMQYSVDKIKYKPIRLHYSRPEYIEGRQSVLLGWGDWWEVISLNLQQGILPLLSNSRVRNWSNNASIYARDSLIAAGYPSGNVAATHGDSGGPLVVWDGDQWVQIGVLVGIISYSDKNTDLLKHVSMSTKLSFTGIDDSGNSINYMKWISDTVGSDVLKNQDYFVGAPLSKNDTSFYDSKICDVNEWVNKKTNEGLPEICTSMNGQ